MAKIYTKFGQNIHKLDTFDGFSRRSKLFFSLNCPKCNEEQFKGQKSHDPLKKTLKIVNYEQYCMWRPFAKIYEKRYKKSASSYHTQTGYIKS